MERITFKKLSKLECCFVLNREYTVDEYLTPVTDPKIRKALTIYRLSEHSLAVEKGRCRQIWLSREDRLWTHCPQNEVETELHFLTSCQMYGNIRDTYFPQITQTHKAFENKSSFDKLISIGWNTTVCNHRSQIFWSVDARKRQPVKSKNHCKYNLFSYFSLFTWTICISLQHCI